jgi:exodeoxyribonuclease VII small subunit
MAKKTQIPPKSFEEALAELEQILAEIEGGELGLEESLVKYERGNFLIHHCRGVLNVAEKQIELLSKSADGGLVAVPMQEPPETPAPAAADPAEERGV